MIEGPTSQKRSVINFQNMSTTGGGIDYKYYMGDSYAWPLTIDDLKPPCRTGFDMSWR